MVFGISKIHTNVDFTFSNNNHNDGKKVYLDKIPLYVYNYVHNHIDTKLQIQVTKIRPAIKCQYKIKNKFHTDIIA